MWDPGKYRKGGIRANTEKVGSRLVPKMWDPGKYREGGIQASTRKVGSGQVPEMGNPSEMLENPKPTKRNKQT